MATAGLVTIASQFGQEETLERLTAAIRSRGLTVFARVDHAGGAVSAGLPLRPTEVVIFGNARGGTPLMQADQAIGLDLPLKALVYRDERGTVWLAYNDPKWLAGRYGLGESVAPSVTAIGAALQAISSAATHAHDADPR